MNSELRNNPTVRVRWSESADDPEWDAFLESSRLGEYTQSTMWGRAKRSENWRSMRAIVVDAAEEILGGFQVQWRKSQGTRIGHVSRGPVFNESFPEIRPQLVSLLHEAAHRLKLNALIVQAPECDGSIEAQLATNGFLPNRIRRIITATWITPVDEGMELVQARMRRSTRNTWRKALRRGVTVQTGGESDLGVFFDLMSRTCERQGVAPNPGSVEALRDVWRAFGSGARCRLTLALHDGKPLSGLFCLCFGKKVHLWKKGSNPESFSLHPMEPLYFDTLAWAAQHGFEACDYGGVNRRTAETLLEHAPLGDETTSSRDFYNMGFGGHPVLLPKARVFIRNLVLRALYRASACTAFGTTLLRSCYEC
jgi:hypothetical protein